MQMVLGGGGAGLVRWHTATWVLSVLGKAWVHIRAVSKIQTDGQQIPSQNSPRQHQQCTVRTQGIDCAGGVKNEGWGRPFGAHALVDRHRQQAGAGMLEPPAGSEADAQPLAVGSSEWKRKNRVWVLRGGFCSSSRWWGKENTALGPPHQQIAESLESVGTLLLQASDKFGS
jgi:hypothetical protein